jgi:hypothetical protein
MQKYVFIFAVVLPSTPFTQAVAEVQQLDIEKTRRDAQPLLGNDNTENAGTLGNANEAGIYQQCMQSETAV